MSVYTTHITGTLTTLSDAVAAVFTRRRGPAATRAEPRVSSGGAADVRSGRFSLALFSAFLLGAALAAFVVPRWRPGLPLVVPIAITSAVAVVDALWSLGHQKPRALHRERTET